HQMVRNVFRLDERQIGSMMIPRGEIAWLDSTTPIAEALAVIAAHEHSRYPVCRGGLDEVLGVVGTQHLLQQVTSGKPLSLTEGLQPPVFVPETLTGMELLEQFRGSTTQMVFVVDEYGEVQGVITLRDVLEAITGEFTTPTADDAWAVQREDGSWLIDGLIPVPELKDRLGLKELPDEDRGRYNTLAGMTMLLLGRLPQTADVVEWAGWRFEVVDLDGKRVDKVLVNRLKGTDEASLTSAES
ncbi:MAG: hemolysin family protein, partial [Hylemonella sp.]|nr:hemolysin family protein [Hylemonella sp.]